MKERLKKRKRLNKIQSTILSPFHLEADLCKCGVAISVSGVKSVQELDGEKIRLKCSVGALEVHGDSMEINVYENNTVEISGKVETVQFFYAKN